MNPLENRAPSERFPKWEKLYAESEVDAMPWFNPEIDADLESALERLGAKSGKFLDIGTGPGTQAAQLSKMGFEVTGTDLSPAAIQKAKKRFEALPILFQVDDITQSQLKGPFDFAFDRGCFHVLAPGDRKGYAKTLHRILSPGGVFFLKCFSHQEQDWGTGPWRFTGEQIEEIFGDFFRVERVSSTVYQGRMDPLPQALFVVMGRK